MLDLGSRSKFSPLPATGAVTVRCPQDASTCVGVWREGNDGLGWRWWRGGGLRPPYGTRFGVRSESSASGQIEPPANVRFWTLPLPSGPSQIHPPLRPLALASRLAYPPAGRKSGRNLSKVDNDVVEWKKGGGLRFAYPPYDSTFAGVTGPARHQTHPHSPTVGKSRSWPRQLAG
jgi:hypothetical protein